MWLIPGKTKMAFEIFKNIGIPELIIAFITAALCSIILLSSLPFKYYIAIVLVILVFFLCYRIDDEPNYLYVLHIIRYFAMPRKYVRTSAAYDSPDSSDDLEETADLTEMIEELEEEEETKHKGLRSRKKKKAKKPAKKKSGKAEMMADLCAFTYIDNDLIEYADKYYGAVIAVPPVDFRLFTENRKKNAIVNGLGRAIHALPADFSANIVKIERPVHYEKYRELEEKKLDDLRKSYESGILSEDELKARVEIIYDRINEIDTLIEDDPVIIPHYYLVLFDSDTHRLERQVDTTMQDLSSGELNPQRLTGSDIAVFLKYTNTCDVNEKEAPMMTPEGYTAWARPSEVEFTPRRTKVNGIVTHIQKVIRYPDMVPNAWMASVMSMPGTKVVMKVKPMDLSKAVRNIDKSILELNTRYSSSGNESVKMEIENHIDTLRQLLSTLQSSNETLLETNIYVTSYDVMTTEALTGSEINNTAYPRITNMKQAVKRIYNENGMRLSSRDFEQLRMFIGSQVSAYDPYAKEGRGIPGTTIAASFPWVFSSITDEKGFHLGSSDGVPVMVDFFQRDSERVNSNMVIVGKSGSGKSFATKSILANLAADGAKIFILDPENEYAELAENLHGKFINVANSQYGRLNPFQIMTALDDEDSDEGGISGSYSTHLQFLEEFFKQILPDCDKDALEYLNSIVDRMYLEHGITNETNVGLLRPSDYPVFDDLYDAILQEFQQTDNEYIRTMLRTLMNYISKFSTGGRNATIWNGEGTITTEENFCVFNFQSLLANRNSTIANAQMLLVLKYIDNEIIKNRDYNIRYGTNRKIVVVIDEAHVFIDTKFPVALDFMFQLAKRIRKYNGMQIVITQNIKDFVGSEEIARKSTAIINACQYSMIFSLAPNDMDDLVKLYEKAGGINEIEQEQIASAQRGEAFVAISPTKRTTFNVVVPEDVIDLFENRNFVSRYFTGTEGEGYWSDFIADSRTYHDEAVSRRIVEREEEEENIARSFVTFEEVDEIPDFFMKREEESSVSFETVDEEIPETPVQPAAPAVQQVQTAPETEKLLLKILDNLSTSNMEYRIKDAVTDEVNRKVEARLAGMQLAAAQPAAAPSAPVETPVPAPQPVYEEPEEDEDDEVFSEEEDDDLLSDLFSDSEEDDDDDEEFDLFSDDEDEDDEEDDDDDDDSDILSLLTSELDARQKTSSIEEMELYEEEVLDITVDDLKLFVKNKKSEEQQKGWYVE